MEANVKRIFIFLLVIFPLLGYSQLNSGLIAHLPLNGNGTDISGNGNNATVSAYGVTPCANYLAIPTQAMFFSGASDNGIMSFNTPLLNNRAAFSMSFWFNLSSLTNGMSMVGQDNILETGFYTGPNRITVYHPTSGSVGVNLTLGANNWQHFVITCDNTGMKVYLNNVLSLNLAGNYSLTNNTTNTNIGGNVVNQSNNSWFRGSIDEVRFYDRVLNATEVGLLYNNSPLTITVNTINAASFCAGDSVHVNFTASADIYAGNNYILQMSNATGSFTNPIPLATISSTALSATFHTVIPLGTPSGSGYKFRVVSTNLNAIGAASGTVNINGLLGNIPNPGTFRYIGNVGGKDYYVSLSALSYANARSSCVANGGVLATIPNHLVNELLMANAIGTKDWIGFTDEVTEGNFVWESNSPISYLNWGSGQPDNSSNEDYGEMWSNVGTWNDRTGTDLNNYFMQLAPAGASQTVCQGAALNLSAITIAGAAYTWSGPNGFTSFAQNPVIPAVTAAAAGTYTVTITAGGCSATGTTVVTVNPQPVNIGQNSTLLPSLNTGLVLYYPMNGNAADASGGGNNGALLGGVTATTDRFGNAGQALQFNGTNGYIDVPDGVYFTGGDFTVSAWVRVAAYNSWSRLFDFGNGAQSNNVILSVSNTTTGKPAGDIYVGAASGGLVGSNTALALNTWQLLTYTYTNNIGTIYINGVQMAQGVQGTPANINRTINYIGRSNWSSDAYANARYDDFRIYNRIISTQEIQSLYNEQPVVLANIITPGTVCAGGSGQIVIRHPQPGMSYQLRNATTSTNIGAAQIPSVDSLVFNTGSISTTTSFNFVITNPFTGCSMTTSPALTLTISPAPAAPTVLNDSVCNAGMLVLHASGLTGTGAYNWYNQAVGGTAIAGITADSLTTPFLDESQNYWVSITNNIGCEGPRALVTATILNPLNPPVDIVSGLILYYKFNGNLADSSGYGYNGTITGSNTYIADRNGIATAAINSTATGTPGNNYISSGNPAQVQQLTNQITISTWIRQTQTWFGSSGTDGFMPLVNKWNGSTGMYMALHMTNPGTFQNRIRWRINGAVYVESTVNVPVSTWHHVVCTYNGTQLKIYQNGVQTGSLTYTGTIANTGNNLYMGYQADGGGDITYRGDWDQARIYNRALNSSEIQTLYNNESVAFGNSPLCSGQGNITLSTFNFPGATYSWTGPNGFTSSQQNPPVITNATTANSGVYHLRVNNYGCTSYDQMVNVLVNPLPAVTLSINDTVCGSGNADLVVGGAPAGSTYNWYTLPATGTPISGQTDSTYTVNSLTTTTTYYVSAVSQGCEGPRTAVTAVYNSNTLTNLTVTGDTVCSNVPAAMVGVNASEAGVNYQAFLGTTAVSNLVAGGGNIVLNINTAGLSVGNNTLTIKATKPGCGPVTLTNTAIVTILAIPVASITPGGPTTFCNGSSVILTASGGTSYLWSTTETSQSINVTTSGAYNVTITGANGCTNTSANMNITVNPIPAATINAGGPVSFCSGGSVTLTGGGGGTYLWNTGATGSSINITNSGTYHVTVTTAGCSSVSPDIVVDVLALPAVGTTALPSSAICQGNMVTLSGTGAVSYSWSGSVVDGAAFLPSATATYTVTGTGANGCTGTALATITVNALPVVGSAASPSTTVCEGNSLTFNGTGASSYTWSGGIVNGVAFIPVSSGTYTVTGTDINGCSNTNSMTIIVHTLPVVNATANPGFTVCAGDDVILQGNGAQTYTWSGGVTDNVIFQPAASGNYTVTGTDANGCTYTSTVALTVNTLPAVDAGADQAVCQGDSVTLTGTGAATLVWDHGVTDQIPFIPVNTLVYTLTGTNGNGCSNTDQVTVTVNSLPVVDAGADQVSCGGSPVTFSGSGAVSYTWSGGITNNIPFVPTSSGAYTVTGTDANNCSNTDVVNVTLGSVPFFNLGADILQPNPPALLNAGTGWSTIQWSTGETTQSINVNNNATITCTVTNADGCSATDTVQVWFTAGIAGAEPGFIHILLYPNPNNGVFQIRFDELVTDQLSIEIIDMLGQTVYIASHIQAEGTYTHLVNLPDMRIGVYTVKCSFNGQQQQLRFIKHQ